ncbi:MAG: hypothetical protein WCE46_03965 [Methanoregula sp.]|uniref:hypothetical protein n=1 Tax=Methanoregula sp. TaxID=2052170 RepID=UPI003C73B4C8
MTCSYVEGTIGHFRCACTSRSRCPKGRVIDAGRITPGCFTIGGNTPRELSS